MLTGLAQRLMAMAILLRLDMDPLRLKLKTMPYIVARITAIGQTVAELSSAVEKKVKDIFPCLRLNRIDAISLQLVFSVVGDTNTVCSSLDQAPTATSFAAGSSSSGFHPKPCLMR